jgi:acyl carrier protein
LELERLGAAVHLPAVDVASAAQMRIFFQRFDSEAWPPIRGVIHAAGVLEDHVIASLRKRSAERVMRPKVIGSWLVHESTQDCPLDFFVLFSSAAAVLGSPGQCAHAGANAFLDALARLRAARSFPAQSINWGPWSGVGAAARQSASSRLTGRGIAFLTPEQGVSALERAFGIESAQIAVLPMDWPRFVEETGTPQPFLTRVHSGKSGTSTQTGAGAQARPADSQPRLIEAREIETKLIEACGQLLLLGSGQIDPTKPLPKLGFDSLMAVQLQNEIELHFGCNVPLNEISQTSIGELAERIARITARAGEVGIKDQAVAPV